MVILDCIVNRNALHEGDYLRPRELVFIGNDDITKMYLCNPSMQPCLQEMRRSLPRV